MDTEEYLLRWEQHERNLQAMCSKMLYRQHLCDVTIVCDGQLLKAHRFVLSACSDYFDAILSNWSANKEMVVILKDCRFNDMKCLIDFMYNGEVSIDQNQLPSLIKTAEELQIKGLAKSSIGNNEQYELLNQNSNNFTTNFPKPIAISNNDNEYISKTDTRGQQSQQNQQQQQPISNNSTSDLDAPNLDDQMNSEQAEEQPLIIPKLEKSDFSQFQLDEYEEDGDEGEDDIEDTKSMTNEQDGNYQLYDYNPIPKKYPKRRKHFQNSKRNNGRTDSEFCTVSCPLTCSEVISINQRNILYKKFQMCGNSVEKRNQFIQSFVKIFRKKEKRVSEREYYLTAVNGTRHRVCKKFFMATFKMSTSAIHRAVCGKT